MTEQLKEQLKILKEKNKQIADEELLLQQIKHEEEKLQNNLSKNSLFNKTKKLIKKIPIRIDFD